MPPVKPGGLPNFIEDLQVRGALRVLIYHTAKQLNKSRSTGVGHRRVMFRCPFIGRECVDIPDGHSGFLVPEGMWKVMHQRVTTQYKTVHTAANSAYSTVLCLFCTVGLLCRRPTGARATTTGTRRSAATGAGPWGRKTLLST